MWKGTPHFTEGVNVCGNELNLPLLVGKELFTLQRELLSVGETIFTEGLLLPAGRNSLCSRSALDSEHRKD
jgi:hypothetical protein